MNAVKKDPTIWDVDRMCAFLGIDTLDEYWERNIDNCECQTKGEEYWDSSKHEYVIAEDDYTCESCEFNYADKVSEFFEKLCNHFDLEMREIPRDTPKKLEHAQTWKLTPKKSWHKSSKELIEVINGYGLFGFNSRAEGIQSGPYKSAKEFFMQHIGWMTSYYEVYEGSKIKSMFEPYAFKR